MKYINVHNFAKAQLKHCLIVIALLVFVGCQSSNDTNDNIYTDVYSIYVTGKDVYAVGSVCQGTSETDVPTLWKNGIAQPVGEMGNFNKASSVFVANNDVYVTITEEHNKAILWENGKRQVLWNGVANCVFVNGKDVYVVGECENAPVLWKNGIMQLLGLSGSAESIVVNGNNVYVAGYMGDCFNSNAVYWKNGEIEYLGQGSANSICVANNGDVYVAGTINMNTAALWKNGLLSWTEKQYTSHAYSITTTNNGKVVISGDAWNSPPGWMSVVWIDGICYNVYDKMRNQAMSVIADGNSIYIGGNGKGDLWSVWKYDGIDSFKTNNLKRVQPSNQ